MVIGARVQYRYREDGDLCYGTITPSAHWQEVANVAERHRIVFSRGISGHAKRELRPEKAETTLIERRIVLSAALFEFSDLESRIRCDRRCHTDLHRTEPWIFRRRA